MGGKGILLVNIYPCLTNLTCPVLVFTNFLSLASFFLCVCIFLPTAEECSNSDLTFVIPLALGVVIGLLLILGGVCYLIARQKIRPRS